MDIQKLSIEIDEEKCIGCGACKEGCPKGSRIWNIKDKAMATNFRFCMGCTDCTKCPQGAVTRRMIWYKR